MTEQLRKRKRKEIISKKRENMALNQVLQEGAGYSEQEFSLPSQEDEYGYEDSRNNRSIRLTNFLTTNNE